MRKRTTNSANLKHRLATALCVGLMAATVAEVAEAEEIVLTGPLAGAPPVRKQRLYRQGRFEFSPSVSFSLLDEYRRNIFVGARLNYNLTDWLAIGGWGAYNVVKIDSGLVDEIQELNGERRQENNQRQEDGLLPTLNSRLTALNMGRDFADQLGDIEWIASPQLTLVPFRGKISIFQSIFADSDFYFFGGPAFVGLREREDCERGQCVPPSDTSYAVDVYDGNGNVVDNFQVGMPNDYEFPMASKTAIAPTFGLGFTFYMGKWAGLGFEWRGLPVSRNTGGFDNRGGGPDNDFPDRAIDSDDSELKFNQLLTVSFNIYLPFEYKISE